MSTAVGRVALVARDLADTSWRVLARYGLPLLGIAALGALGAYWCQELAVVASRRDAVLGMLVFAFVPAVAFGATVAMLLLVGRRGERRASSGGLGLLGSALLIFLLIYEQDGRLREQRRQYLAEAFEEAVWSEDQSSAADRIPDATSLTVLAIVVAAFVLRVAGAAVLERWDARRRAAGRTRPAVAAVALRLVVAYAEIVWIVLAVVSVVTVLDNVGAWWSDRVVVHAVSQWWRDLALPDVTGLVGAVSGAVGFVAAALVAGIVVPLVWLALAAMLYGSRFGEVGDVAARAARATAAAQQRLGSVAGWLRRPRGGVGRAAAVRSGPGAPDLARLERSWVRLTQPEGRWDALGGAAGLAFAMGWVPVLVFCILFTLVSRVRYVVWWAAELLPLQGGWEWRLATDVVETVATILAEVLMVCVAAAGADYALRSAGLGTALRLQRSVSVDGERPVGAGVPVR